MKKPTTNLSPFHGRPVTKQFMGKDGELGFRIYPRELTPLRAKLADKLAPLSAVLAILEGFLVVEMIETPPDWIYWAVICGPILASPLLKLFYRFLLKRRWLMVITPDQFKVLTWHGWQIFEEPNFRRFLV